MSTDVKNKDPNRFLKVRFFKWFDEIRKEKPRFIALIVFTILSVTYLSSLISQMMNGGFRQYDVYGNVTKISFSPFSTITNMIADGNILYPAYGLIGIGLAIMIARMGLPTDRYDERGFTISQDGTYGTSGWMSREEIEEQLLVININEATGPVFGRMDDHGNVLSFRSKPEYEGDLRPYRFNKNAAIYGASGSGKSRAYVRNQIFQVARRNESMVITDPKSEMYDSMAGFLEDQGYTVRVFNLVNPNYSDSWNSVAEVMEDEDQLELMAQTFTSVVIANTMGPGGRSDHFWDNAEMNLLKALLLYVVTDKSRRIEDKNFGEVYRLLTEVDANQLEAMFDALPPTHAAKQPWNIFVKAGPQVKGNVIIGLGSRLQVFQAGSIRKLTADIDIDLTQPGKEKTAIFLIMSDQDSTLNFLSSLFFSFIFIKLVRYADYFGEGGRLPVPVNFILDEFPNIGQIPDFEKKISTVRSRDINISLIFQNLAQLQNRYPQGTWEEILGNCDAQLFLGCTDQLTAEYVSKRTGELTVEVDSTQVQRQSIAITDHIPTYRSTESVGKRMLLTPDEVLRLPNDTALLIARGCKVVKLKKLDYSLHPDYHLLRDVNISEYIPYRKKLNESKAKERAEKRENMFKNKDSQKWTTKSSGETVQNEPRDHKVNSESTVKKDPQKTSWVTADDNIKQDSNIQDVDTKPVSSFDEKMKEKMKNRKSRPTFRVQTEDEESETFKKGGSNLG